MAFVEIEMFQVDSVSSTDGIFFSRIAEVEVFVS